MYEWLKQQKDPIDLMPIVNRMPSIPLGAYLMGFSKVGEGRGIASYNRSLCSGSRGLC